jgi:hypothetical protein
MKIHLKVKVASLAAEARLIRRMERSLARKCVLGTDLRRSTINHHRRVDLRKEARASQLAYAFLRDRAYEDVEGFAYTSPDWKRVESIAQRFAEDLPPQEFAQKFEEWLQAAKAHYALGDDGHGGRNVEVMLGRQFEQIIGMIEQLEAVSVKKRGSADVVFEL